METVGTLVLLAIGFGLFVAAAIAIFIGWRLMYRVVKPSEADVVTGAGAHMSKETRARLEQDRARLIEEAQGDAEKLRRIPEVPDFKIVRSGGYLKKPGQRVTTVNRAIHHSSFRTTSYTMQGVPVNVEAVVLYRVADDELSVARYACRFDDEQAMVKAVEEVFESKAREVLGTLSVHQILTDRESFGTSVRQACTDDFNSLGLSIENFTIKSVTDDQGYIEAIGAKDTAEVKKQARIAEADAEQIAAEREAETAALTAQAQAKSDIEQSEARAQAEQAKATAAAAGPLAEAKAQQEVIRQETENEKLNAELEDQRLQATVYKQADAQKYQTVTNAQAARAAAEEQAEAEAMALERAAAADRAAAVERAAAVQAQGEGEAAAERARGLAAAEVAEQTGLATAKVTREQGLATAAATEAEGLARAAGLAAEGEALTANQDAMIAMETVRIIPAAVGANAQAFSRIGNMTVMDGVSSVNGGLQQTMTTALAFIPQLLSSVKGDNGLFGGLGQPPAPMTFNNTTNVNGNGAEDLENAKPALTQAAGHDMGAGDAASRAGSTFAKALDNRKSAIDQFDSSELLDGAEKAGQRLAQLDADELAEDVSAVAGRADEFMDTAEKGLDEVDRLAERAEQIGGRVATVARKRRR